jgi:hypothetical protein
MSIERIIPQYAILFLVIMDGELLGLSGNGYVSGVHLGLAAAKVDFCPK